ncbi:phosphate regulon sensor histidine kinase PhoR [Caldimonas tepidiphila]|uniref:phosphate regulon sensor histidine kinase PhoR n=1 Tax=Caldimonas tepidiphila TaxID=2315841 RepID=UPI000E5A1778|nr:phosphate regulon sensor histidine kinase PhoR [Caldimonas tepidiphila]
MSWLLPRILAALLCGLLGASLGAWLGQLLDAPLLGAIVGAGGLGALLGFFDTLRAYRLVAWLRGSQRQAAPRTTGMWGELGYRIERALRQRELGAQQERDRLSQFLSAVEASPNGVLLLDASDQIEWANRTAAEHFGLDPVRDRQQRVTNLVRAPAFVAYLQGGHFDEPVVFPRPQGRGTLSVLAQRYGEGMTLVLSQDITERERADTMRRDFVANVSHEIRTPLTVLAGFIETMSSLPLTEVERKRVLDLMGQQARRMQTLVADLLTLAQLEGSPRPPSDRWVPVARLLAQVEGDARGLSQERHRIETQCDGGTMLVAGAEGELLSAWSNLVSNAIRYTPPGGTIRIGWRLLPDGSGEFSVRDTGIGIAREHLPRLTERFYRVDGSRSRETGGTGLGLSIVKHVVQRHGGELHADSEPGKGSLFRLVFPAMRVRTPEAVAGELQSAARAASDAAETR